MTPNTILLHLAAARRDVDDATEARRQAVQHRDTLIAAAREAGIPWTSIQTAAGLTARGVSQAIARNDNVRTGNPDL